MDTEPELMFVTETCQKVEATFAKSVRLYLSRYWREELGPMYLGNPSELQGNLFAVGCGPSTAPRDRYLSCCDITRFADFETTPVVCSVHQGQPFTYVVWPRPNCIVAGTAGGELRIFSVNLDERPSLKLTNTLKVHKVETPIRELAVPETTKNIVISGGADGLLSFTDLEKVQSVHEETFSSAVTSVFSGQTSGVGATLTTDDGVIAHVDMNTSGAKVLSNVSAEHGKPTCHTALDRGLYIGTSEGYIVYYDVRKPEKPIANIRDPCVDFIGALDIHLDSRFLVSSGMQDFCVWQYSDSQGPIYTSSSRSQVAPSKGGPPYTVFARWLPDQRLLTTDSKGAVSITRL